MKEKRKDAATKKLLQIEEYAKENNLYFSQDDVGNCYLSKNEECEQFEEVEGFEI